MITVAQVSDIHFGTSDRNEARANRLFARLASLTRPLDALVITGDIADNGRPEEYEKARALISTLPFPVLSLPRQPRRARPFQRSATRPRPRRRTSQPGAHRGRRSLRPLRLHGPRQARRLPSR